MTPEQYHRASDLFLEVCDLPEPQRRARLEEAFGKEPTLRTEVESLLRVHTETPPQPSVVARRAFPTPTPTSRGRLWKRRLQVLLPAALLLVAGAVVLVASLRSFESRLLDGAAAALRTTLDRRAEALRAWIEERRVQAARATDDALFTARVAAVLKAADESPDSSEGILRCPDYAPLVSQLMSLPGRLDDGWGITVITSGGRIVAADPDFVSMVGKSISAAGGEYLRRLMLGERVVSLPCSLLAHVEGQGGGRSAEPAIMWAAAPIRDAAGRIVAGLVLRFRSQPPLGRLLHPPALGARSECFLFDDSGRLLTEPGDPERLRSLGLAGGPPGTRVALHAVLRDPGGDLEAGYRPADEPALRPLTEIVRTTALSLPHGDSRIYRNLRGRDVIGAGTWLADWRAGLAVEADVQEILAPAKPTRVLAAGAAGVLALTALASALLSARYRLVPRDPRGTSFGAYRLERRIGRGGSAEVFLARHLLLKRPTAVKVLGGDGSDPDAVARFEREARLMSTLTHPNTVQLFDYGRTPEGHLYLAMEHLDGLNLSQLVSIAGPLPPARVIHLLAQICGSLAEAHAAGLVHRDLKPGNVMVCRRGGLADQVKVLDFGIARPIGESTRELTRTGSLTGTPLYIAPERIQNPQDADPRSDLYSLGAVAYLLLAGRNVFEGNGPAEVLMQSLSAVPPPPSRIRGTPLPAALERLVLDLLAKKPADRPASAAETARRLRGIETLDSWDAAAAEAWWNEHDARVRALVRATAE